MTMADNRLATATVQVPSAPTSRGTTLTSSPIRIDSNADKIEQQKPDGDGRCPHQTGQDSALDHGTGAGSRGGLGVGCRRRLRRCACHIRPPFCLWFCLLNGIYIDNTKFW